tara:strand:+ start:1399 stop:2604 length:1206 start_codon:yes stop_codon:yes gene_type:complete
MQTKFNKYIRFSEEKNLQNELKKVKVISDNSNTLLNSVCTKHQYETSLNILSNGLEITELNSPILSSIFENCKKTLFPSKNIPNISLYLTPDLVPNASCIYLDKNEYIININSSLLDLLSKEELAFIIGHEIGHLKFKHHQITSSAQCDSLSATLELKIMEYNRMCEITADRSGFICSGFEDATQALFKLSVGTKSELVKLNLLQINNQLGNLSALLDKKIHLRQSKLSHPYSLIRLIAINEFKNFTKSSKLDPKNLLKIDKVIIEALAIMSPKAYVPEELLLMYACFWVAYCDKNVQENEIQSIYSFCSGRMVDEFNTEVISSKNKLAFIIKSFKDHFKKNSSITRPARATILEKLLCIAKADGMIRKIELDNIRTISKLLDIDTPFVERSIQQFTKKPL